MRTTTLQTQCCIAGGGPAGLMLGLLLARAGVNVIVLEKHADFLRDFRGDTIHPSTMAIIDELGWLDEFLCLPHEPVARLTAQFGSTRLTVADFSHLPVRTRFIAMMPQWDFLNFLAAKAKHYSSFNLIMRGEATALIEEGGRVCGVRAQSADGEILVRADLVVAADGRQSVLRDQSGLAIEDFGAPMDVLWFRLSRRPDDTGETQARVDAGRIFIMLNRGDYWQCAFVIPKASYDRLQAAGIAAFRVSLASILPISPARADEIQAWDQLKLLTVQVNRLKRWWRDGFLCIGDAAHAMSPIGGVGVNLAVQDAVAAANSLAVPLREGRAGGHHLAAVENRRMWPTRATQRMQLGFQRTVIGAALNAKSTFEPPFLLRALLSIPGFNRLPARLIGLGVRPEHVQSPEVG
jgi:2-polyprenyl-6-methoxyphenol hydroxylase-like FAD-dependent oxidoreductase